MSQATDTAPVPQLAKAGPRIDSLDLLRGIAILGIFLMNTWTMSLPQGAYTNPASYNPNWWPLQGFPVRDETGNVTGHNLLEPLTGINHWVYVVIHLFADMKFITMFSVLFGAGIVLQAERSRKKGRNPWPVHYMRMAVLLLFGLAHTFGFWYGDILTDYAICGMLLAPMRLLPAWALFLGGMGIVFVPTAMEIAHVAHQREVAAVQTYEEREKVRNGWYKPIDTVHKWQGDLWDKGVADFNAYMAKKGVDATGYYENDRELTAYQGSWWGEIVGHRFWCSVSGHTTGLLTWTFWRCGGCFLIGMALQKRRFFHGAWPLGAYATIAALAIPAGWTISYLGVMFNQRMGWVESDDLFSLWHMGTQFNYWGSLLCSVGYMCCGVLLADWAAKPNWSVFNKWLTPIRSIGRMALTCYLGETLIGTTLYYCHGIGGVNLGFGWFGKTTRLQNVPIVLGTWLFMMIFATLWLTMFKQGPLEWFWHSIVYWDWKNPRIAAAGPDVSLSPSVKGVAGTDNGT